MLSVSLSPQVPVLTVLSLVMKHDRCQRAHGESGWTARMVPLTVFDSARRKTAVPALARWLLGLGIATTLAANVNHGLGHGLIGAAVAACRIGRLLRTPHGCHRQLSGVG